MKKPKRKYHVILEEYHSYSANGYVPVLWNTYESDTIAVSKDQAINNVKFRFFGHGGRVYSDWSCDESRDIYVKSCTEITNVKRGGRLIFYDFEVFKHDFMCVLIDPAEPAPYVVINDKEQLEKIYDRYKNDIWIGFNSRHYDQYILKGILCDMNAWDINNHIIVNGQPGWTYSSLLRKIFLINYDVMPLNSSLKQLEGFQGHNIHESSVDFTIDRPLTDAEIKETVKYCTNDVQETMNVFAANINDFTALMWLIKEFDFPLSYMSKTKAQISAEILQCEQVTRSDEWDIFTLDCLRLTKYRAAAKWFTNAENHDYKKKFTLDVAGVKHLFGWGGIHGAREKYHYRCDNDHLILHVDVASYYPRLMIFHNLLTRNAKKPERFRQIYEQRLKLKHEGKKKEQAPLKIVINGTFGICKDETNKAYDPRNANLICVNGQLLLLDLIEKMEQNVHSFQLIQSNTDGLIIKIHRRDFERVDDICFEWESRCSMELEFDYIREIWQKDVNNYVFVQMDGKTERKGAYVKELSAMDNDLPIINRAIVDYMLKGIPVESTINGCDQLIEFQKICKLTSKYNAVTHNGTTYRNKCYRIFASRRDSDGVVQKVKDGRRDKFANTSEHSFIENSDITGMKVPEHLNKKWYIDLAKERLEQYGVNVC